MDKEKIFDAGANQPQEKSTDELLNEEELSNVAGGDAGTTGHGVGIDGPQIPLIFPTSTPDINLVPDFDFKK